MRPGIFRDLLILVTAGVLVFYAGYFVVRNVTISEPEFNYDVSIEQEEQLGTLMKDGLWDHFPAVHNDIADTTLQRITTRLLFALDSTPYRYQFRIIDNEQVNAFTIPGGNIFVFSGLLQMSESPEEVAAVVAHEIGHAEQRHVVKKLVNEFSIAVIVSILAGGDPSLVLQIIQQVIGSKFSREHEEEADEYALQLLENARIDPKNLGVFFSRLNDKDLSYNRHLELIMTHPHNDARIRKVKSYKPKPGFMEEKFNLDWVELKKSLE